MRSDTGPYDVVIVGGGIIGCWAAYHLARDGYRVAVLEKGRIGGEASGRNAGGIRQNGRSPNELPLAMHAVSQWAGMDEALRRQFEYVQSGNLVVAFGPHEQERLRQAALVAQLSGLDIRHITDPYELRQLVPDLTPQAVAGNYVASDGQCQPYLATRIVARLAEQAGASLLLSTEVTRIITSGGAVAGVETNRGTFSAPSVVLAAGPWSIALAAALGLRLPVLVRRTQACVTEPLPPILTPWLTSGTVWIRQTVRGNIMMGGGGPWEDLAFTKESSLPSLQRFARRVEQTLPRLKDARLLRGWAGSLDVTPDFQVIVDRVREVRGLVLAVGTCGHGFALGPSVGQACAELATQRESSVPISGLGLYRFPADLGFPGSYQVTAEPL